MEQCVSKHHVAPLVPTIPETERRRSHKSNLSPTKYCSPETKYHSHHVAKFMYYLLCFRIIRDTVSLTWRLPSLMPPTDICLHQNECHALLCEYKHIRLRLMTEIERPITNRIHVIWKWKLMWMVYWLIECNSYSEYSLGLWLNVY